MFGIVWALFLLGHGRQLLFLICDKLAWIIEGEAWRVFRGKAQLAKTANPIDPIAHLVACA